MHGQLVAAQRWGCSAVCACGSCFWGSALLPTCSACTVGLKCGAADVTGTVAAQRPTGVLPVQGLLALRLQGPARQHKGLRRHLAHFTRDVLAVLVGLRAAVMLDYMVIPPKLTLGIIQRLNMTCAGQRLMPCPCQGCAARPPAT